MISAMLPTIEWTDDAIVMVDQRKLPGEETYVRCRSAQEVAKAIKTMVIRGAPAIGVAAAMGLALCVRQSKATGTQKLAVEFYRMCDVMAGTRPTAVNLFWAIDRMKRSFAAGIEAGESVDQLHERLRTEARHIHDEDVASCRALGGFGASVVPDEARVLTHCNAGALATAGYGTALGVVRAAVEQGKHVAVFADETRPFLQGARLTAWELLRDGIDATLISDSMAGPLMREGRDRPRRRRRGSHRGQRRHGEQDRHLQGRRARARARHSLLRRGPASPRSIWRRRTARTSRSRSATQREVTHLGTVAARRPMARGSATPPST